jgi:UDP-glucose 4-epimerase
MSDYRERYRKERVLVTGGAGAIGSNLISALAEAEAELVIVFDDLSASDTRWNIPSRPNVLFVRGSVLDEVKLKRVFFEQPTIVFHLSAFFANQNSIDHPETDLMVNGLGTLKVLQYSHLARVKRVVFASSGCSIYGSSAPMPLKEEFVSMHLSSPYQITKMLGELYCNFFFNHYGLPVVKARFFNSYGPGEVPGQYRNVIPNFIYWAMRGLPLPITGTGEETRDFTYVGDIVDALLRSGQLQQAIGQELNIASGKEIRIIDLAKLINTLTQNHAGIKYGKRRKWDTKPRLLASIEKAREIIGYEPRTSFEEGVQKTIDWFTANWHEIERAATFGPGVSSAVRDILVTR